MISLTRTGKLLLGVLVLLYFASLTSQSGLLLLLVGIVCGCYVVNLAGAWQSIRKLELKAPGSTHLSEGQRLWQPWRVLNTARGGSGFIEADSMAGTLFRVAALPPGHECSVVPDLVYYKRGVYPHGQVRISSTYPFGFVRASRALDLPGETVVYPAIYETEAPTAAGYDVIVGGKHHGHRRSASGMHFAGVRPLQPGDPFKQIHWRSSAKGLGLMVKTYDEELSGRVAVIMDCGHDGSPDTLDDCLRAVGSLIFASLDAGHHVEWVDLASLNRRLVPPFADGREVLETLARVGLSPGCLTDERLAQAIERTSRRSCVHLVLSEFNPAAGAAVNSLLAQRRQVVLYLPENFPLPGPMGIPLFRYGARSIVHEA